MGKKEDDAVVAVEADRWVPGVSQRKKKRRGGARAAAGLVSGTMLGRGWAGLD